MSKAMLKLGIACMVLVTGVALSWAILSGAASGLAFFRSGADPATVLNTGVAAVGANGPTMEWQADAPSLARPMDPTARTAITESYLRAWEARTGRGDPEARAELFAGSAQAAITADDPPDDVVETVLGHRMHLEFHSADGQLVAFTDTIDVDRRVMRSDGTTWSHRVSERYAVIMILVDGNWRVRHWTRSLSS